MNAEYPWMDGRKEIICPATYGFAEFTNEELMRFATFIENLILATEE